MAVTVHQSTLMEVIESFLNMLKIAFNESLNWEKSMVKPNANNMNVIPVRFNSEHKELLSHLA